MEARKVESSSWVSEGLGQVPERWEQGLAIYGGLNSILGGRVFMGAKRFLIVSLIFMVGLVSSSSAAVRTWTGGGGINHLWSTSGNWNTGIPTASDEADIDLPGASCLIDSSVTAVAADLLVGINYSVYMNITGGTLTAANLYLNQEATSAAVLTISNGTVTTLGDLEVGYKGLGTLNMTGGQIEVKKRFRVPAGSGTGCVNLDGGTISAVLFVYNTDGTMDINITDGKLLIDKDVTTDIADYVSSGLITGYGGAGRVNFAYDASKGKTVISATTAAQAYCAKPLNGAIFVASDTSLTWTPGDLAVTHDVYLGTSFGDVNDADTSSSTYKGRLDANNCSPGPLAGGQTYYWRIDEVKADSEDISKGKIWSFTTVPYTAWGPSPTNAAQNAAADVILKWSAGAAATSHDVYFGTDFAKVNDANTSSSEYAGNQHSDSYNPGLLTPGQTYYWRIDEVGTDETWKGEIWSFMVFDNTGLPTQFKNGYGLWIDSSMMQVFPATRPASYPAEPSVAMSLAGGEHESFQVVILPAPSKVLNNVRVQVSDLVSGKNTIAAKNIKWYLVGYVNIIDGFTTAKSSYFNNGRAYGWWPDLLLEASKFNVSSSTHAQPIWITVYAPPGTPAGMYTGTLTVLTDSGLPAEVDISAEVYGFTLAKGPAHCKTTFGLPRSLSMANVGYRPYADLLLKHRINVDWIAATGAESVSNLEHYYEMGMNRFTICKVQLGMDYAHIDDFLSELEQSDIKDTLLNMGSLYGYDEAGSTSWTAMGNCFSALEARYPDIERLTTAQLYTNWKSSGRTPSGQMNLYSVDWICHWTPNYVYADGDGIRASGKQYWSYLCRVPETSKPTYANFFTLYPVIESRMIWWQMFHQKMDGFLYWQVREWASGGSNSPKIDPEAGPFTTWKYKTISDGGPYGNGVLVYSSNTGPIASMRLANIRDGVEDYEYLWMLSQQLGVEAVRSLISSGSYVTTSLTSFTHTAQTVNNKRDAIARLINWAPSVNAGDTIQIPSAEQANTVIQGTASDKDGDQLKYRWLDGAEVLLDWSDVGPSGAAYLNLGTLPRFAVGNHTLTLEVKEVRVSGNLASDEMVLTIVNQPPVADAGDNIQIASAEQANTVIQGTGIDPDGDQLKYRWLEDANVLVDWNDVGPAGEAYLNLGTLPCFAVEDHTLTLEVKEVGDSGQLASDEMVLTIVNHPPTADSGDNIQIESAQQSYKVIQGMATDEDGDILEYRWLEGEQVLLDWSWVGLGGEAYIDLATLPYLSIGDHALILEAREVGICGLSASDDMVLTVQNSPPVVQSAPKHQVVEVGVDPIVVVGNAGDFDGDMLTYKWLDDGNNVLASGNVSTTPGGNPVSIPDLNISAGDPRFEVGVHTIRLQVSDSINGPVSDSVTVEVIDTTAPSLSPVPSITILWPPNHELIPVTILANAFDNGGGDIVLGVTVQSSEPADAIGDGSTDVDYYVDSVNNETGVIELRLHSERSGKGSGRVYTITITATDANQNQSQAVVQIRAPHDKSKK